MGAHGLQIWIFLGLVVLLAFGLGLGSVLLPHFRRWRRTGDRRLIEDALKHLLACAHNGRLASPKSLAAALGLALARLLPLLVRMESEGLLATRDGGLFLTADGERRALRVVRAHRLWERYLADEAGRPLGELHRDADQAEHLLTPEQLDRIDAQLGHPASDPHGDPIPRADGAVTPLRAAALAEWPPQTPARIVHIEDEPEAMLRPILAVGLRPGMTVLVRARGPDRMVLDDGRAEYRIAPALAAQIHVMPVPRLDRRDGELVRLGDLAQDEAAEVVELGPGLRGLTRRRLLDLGLTPGADVRAELTAPLGDPRAYRVRGTLIALRQDQAGSIWVRPRSPFARDGESEPPKDAGGGHEV